MRKSRNERARHLIGSYSNTCTNTPTAWRGRRGGGRESKRERERERERKRKKQASTWVNDT